MPGLKSRTQWRLEGAVTYLRLNIRNADRRRKSQLRRQTLERLKMRLDKQMLVCSLSYFIFFAFRHQTQENRILNILI